MIVPTTILSLAALSAAESNSSGNRGLRKSSTPWTAIAVVTGTAVTAGVVGGLIGWFTHSATAGKSCAQLTQLGIQGTCTGCAAGFYEKKANECHICPNGKNSPGASFTGANVDDATGCKGCKADYKQTGTGTGPCEACHETKEIAATTEWAAAATSCTERVCELGKKATLTDGKTCKCVGDATNHCTEASPTCHPTTGVCSA